MGYSEGMTSLAAFPDPLVRANPSAFYESTYEWRHTKAFQVGREAYLKGRRDVLNALLDQNEWQLAQEGQPAGISLMAWRGLWSCVRWDSDWGDLLALVKQLPAMPLANDPLHWFENGARWTALERVFSAPRPPKPGSPPEALEKHALDLAAQQELAERLTERWPGLVSLFLQSVRARYPEHGTNDVRVKVYFHPLIASARPGREKDFQRLMAVDGLAPVMALGSEAESPELAVRGRVLERLSPTALLCLGLERGFEPLVDAALDAGARWDGTFDHYRNQVTLLHRFSRSANMALPERVLREGADVEAMDSYGRTPFLAAVLAGNLDLMRRLVDHGANVHASDRFGQTAAHVAVEGLRVADYDAERSTPQSPVYIPRSAEAVQESLERLGLVLGELRRLGVAMDVPCSGPPKNTKKSPSPFAGLPTKRRSTNTAQAGQAWDDQLRWRQERDENVPAHALNMVRSLLLEDHLSRVIAPEPEELPVRSRPRF